MPNISRCALANKVGGLFVVKVMVFLWSIFDNAFLRVVEGAHQGFLTTTHHHHHHQSRGYMIVYCYQNTLEFGLSDI